MLYSDCSLPIQKDAFHFYHLICPMTMDQAFGMLIDIFSVFWSLLRMSSPRYTRDIVVAFELHKFTIDHGSVDLFEHVSNHENNLATGNETIHFQMTYIRKICKI